MAQVDPAFKARALSEEDISAFRDAFTTFDTDQDNYLSLTELANLLDQLGFPLSDEELKQLISEVDVEGNGTVDFKEFIQLMARKMRDFDNQDEYIEAFKIFDKDNDDLISPQEMFETMSIIGKFVWNQTPTEEEIKNMIKEADTDNDGYLSYSDFINKILNK